MNSVHNKQQESNANPANEQTAQATGAEQPQVMPGPYGIDETLPGALLPEGWLGIGPLVGGDADDANEVSCYVAFASPRHAPMFAAAPDLYATCKRIRDARDHHAETGEWPADMREDQQFDDWAADLCAAAIEKASAR